MNTDKAYAERIASEYAPKRDSKVAALKKLDARARRPAEILAYVLGILSALVLGVGMCLSMGVVGPGTGAALLGGIVLGLAGLAGAGLNYPLYRRLLERGKAKYAFEIMELAREISDEA